MIASFNIWHSTREKELKRYDRIYRRIDKKTNKGVMDELVMPENPTSCSITDAFILKNPTRTLYEFKGWKDSKTGQVKKTMSVSNVTTDKTFKAIWISKKYIVKYEEDRKTTKKPTQ